MSTHRHRHTNTDTYMHIYIYIYMCVCVCVCVCAYKGAEMHKIRRNNAEIMSLKSRQIARKQERVKCKWKKYFPGWVDAINIASLVLHREIKGRVQRMGNKFQQESLLSDISDGCRTRQDVVSDLHVMNKCDCMAKWLVLIGWLLLNLQPPWFILKCASFTHTRTHTDTHRDT